jgi:MFS family permease
VASLLCGGAISALAYLIHAGRTPAPILDLNLFRLPTFRASIFGGFLFRLGIGALPFLLPLLLQIGFHLTPFESGLITFTTALGSMFMKAAVASVLHRFGYRNVLLYNALISSVFLTACASFVQGMPFAAMVAILLSGGFFRSLQFTAINTIAYAEIEPAKMSRATAMVAAAQQLSLSTGVAIGALVVELMLRLRHSTTMGINDFPPAFLFVGLLSASAVFIFMRLPPDAGAELAGRKPEAAGESAELAR